MDNVKNKAGRKPVLTLDQKKDIVNRYLIANDQDASILSEYGVYEKLARFARTISREYSNARSYHFYDSEIRSYIAILTNAALEEEKVKQKTKQIGCAYVPLDLAVINQLAHQHRYSELIAVLRSREEYICNLYDKVANAAHQNEFVRSKYFVKVEETQTLIGKNADLEKEINRLSIELEEMKAKCKSLQKENNDLKIMIKNKDNELALKVYKDGLTVKSDLRRFGIDMADAESGEKADKRSKVINLMPYNEED